MSPEAGSGVRRPFIAWIQRVDDEFIAQMFGRASLYAIASNESEAVTRLVEVMREELAQIPDDSSVAELELRTYLEMVLEGNYPQE